MSWCCLLANVFSSSMRKHIKMFSQTLWVFPLLSYALGKTTVLSCIKSFATFLRPGRIPLSHRDEHVLPGRTVLYRQYLSKQSWWVLLVFFALEEVRLSSIISLLPRKGENTMLQILKIVMTILTWIFKHYSITSH